ncbi:MAG: hypothetical protein ABI461_14310, partial [Polyangiaceae bacterium]
MLRVSSLVAIALLLASGTASAQSTDPPGNAPANGDPPPTPSAAPPSAVPPREISHVDAVYPADLVAT